MYTFKNIALAAMTASSIIVVDGFAPLAANMKNVPSMIGNPTDNSRRMAEIPLHVSSSMAEMEQQQEHQEMKTNASSSEGETSKPAPKKKAAPKKPAHGKEGILSPVVLAVKGVMGDDDHFNKLRAKVISLHSDVIEGFVVNNADTPMGHAVLKRLFALADQDHNGSIETSELEKAFRTLGFDWLKEKQIEGIFKRADKNENGHLELEEWMAEAPKTLRTNLIKLAKKNGDELGLLV